MTSRARLARAVVLVAGLVLFAAAARPVLAQAPPPPGGPGYGGPGGGSLRWGMGRDDGELWLMIRAANLSPEQQTKVRAILMSHRAATRALIGQLRQAQQELGAKLLAPGPLQAADLKPQLTRLKQLREEMRQLVQPGRPSP